MLVIHAELFCFFSLRERVTERESREGESGREREREKGGRERQGGRGRETERETGREGGRE